MCQCQLSGSTLASAAFTPPWAATVCERVGNTLDTTATRASAWASCSAARSPAPPAPMIRASNLLLVRDIVISIGSGDLGDDQHLRRPEAAGEQEQGNQ